MILESSGKKLISLKYVKYLGVLIDAHLNWSFHLNLLSSKLSRAIGMLARIIHMLTHKRNKLQQCKIKQVQLGGNLTPDI